MAKIRNISGDDRLVPGLGNRLVLAGVVVELDAADVASYTCQPALWQAVDEEAQTAHDAAETPVEEAPAVETSDAPSEGEAA